MAARKRSFRLLPLLGCKAWGHPLAEIQASLWKKRERQKAWRRHYIKPWKTHRSLPPPVTLLSDMRIVKLTK